MIGFKATVLIALTTLVGACHVGPQLDQTGIGRHPHGATVTVQTARVNDKKRTQHEGELVDVRDDGLLIAIRSDTDREVRIAFAPWKIIRSAKATDWSGFAMRSSQGEAQRARSIAKLRTISRFPQGLSAELLSQLLASSGQTEVDTIE